VFEEWFEVMRRFWTQDLWSFEGEFIQVPPKGLSWSHPLSARLEAGVVDGELRQIATGPKPMQLPHPPMFTMMTSSSATLEWAARVGSSIVTLETDENLVKGLFQAYSDEAAACGRAVRPGEYRPGGGVALCRLVSVASTHEEAMETARQSMAFMGDWLGEFEFFEAWRMPGQEGPVPGALERLVESGAMLVGTPDRVGENVQKLRDTFGVDYLIFIACAGTVEHRRMLDTIGLFGEKVIPAFKAPFLQAPGGETCAHGHW
jgi:alkanesulfonate monooxygenase SsuD/methylene tetrahydromethanopterin reductase-like flavin-dependent oxidoreductase (luciferase family)